MIYEENVTKHFADIKFSFTIIKFKKNLVKISRETKMYVLHLRKNSRI